jgi:AraC-like DNA-binding protein
MYPVILRKQLQKIIQRFFADENRGISVALFAEAAGLSEKTLYNVFVHNETAMTEMVQRRVSKAYNAWLNGELAIMMNRNQTRFVQYRKVPQPKLTRSMGLEFSNGSIKIKTGIRNKADYSGSDLDEQLKGM